MNLEGFVPYILASGPVSISISKNGLGVSKAAVAKLQNAPFVRILIDTKNNRLAIQVCDESDPAATVFSRSEKAEGLRWNTKDLNMTLRKMLGKPVENGECYRIDGDFIEDDHYPALIFDLNEANV